LQENAGYMSPGIHDNVLITEVKAHTSEAKSGQTYEVIDILFTNSKKENHAHRIFNPLAGAEDKVAENAQRVADQLSYIASKVQDKEVLMEATTWEEVCNFAVKNIPVKTTPLKLKLVGNVYGGNARVQITSYPGWLKTMKSGESIKFSKKENEANAEYFAHMNPSVAKDAAPFDLF